jgi:hypothetical protein
MRYWSSRGRARRGDGEGVGIEGVGFVVVIYCWVREELIVLRGFGICFDMRGIDR